MANTTNSQASYDRPRGYRAGKRVSPSAMSEEKLQQVLDLRRSGAATSIPSKKVRRERSRSGRKQAAIRRAMRGE